MGMAELISQQLNAAHKSKATVPERIRNDPSSSTALQRGWQVGSVNVGHVGAFGVLSGAIWLAPMMHTFYAISNAWPIPLRIAVNSLIVDPMNYTSAMICNAVSHGKGLNEGLRTVETKLPSTFVTGLLIWPPVQLISFLCVPVHWRVFLFTNVSLCWNTWLNYQVAMHLKLCERETHVTEMTCY